MKQAQEKERKRDRKTNTQSYILLALILNSFGIVFFNLHNHSELAVQFSHSVVSDSLRPHGLEHARLPYPLPAPGACSNSCPSSQ